MAQRWVCLSVLALRPPRGRMKSDLHVQRGLLTRHRPGSLQQLLWVSFLRGGERLGVPLEWLLRPASGVSARAWAALSVSMCSLVEHRFCMAGTADLIVSFPEAVRKARAFLFPAGKSPLEIIFFF